ncbi:MAG: DivIVA domain-containing protein [Bacillota bacterium]
MALTPLDLQNSKEFRKSTRGYNPKEVDGFFSRVFKDYEDLYRQNLDLQEELAEVREKLNQYQLIEDTLQGTLVLAQQTAEEVKRNAEEAATLMIEKTRQQSEKMLRAAEGRVNEVRIEYERLRQLEQNYHLQLRTLFQTQLAFLDQKMEVFEVAKAEVAAAISEPE